MTVCPGGASFSGESEYCWHLIIHLFRKKKKKTPFLILRNGVLYHCMAGCGFIHDFLLAIGQHGGMLALHLLYC